MHKLLFYIFTGYAFVNVYIQTAELPCRQFTTPIMTGSVGILALIGLLSKKLNKHEGIFLAAAWLLAATGDIFFEKSRLATNPDIAGQAFMLGVGIFLLAYLTFGVNFSVLGFSAKLPKWVYIGAGVIAAIMGVIAYKSLLVPADQNMLVVLYTIQAVILLFGGLLSLYRKHYTFAAIGILLFFSDWLVGMRSFGNPAIVPAYVSTHVLILILVTYYIPMLVSIDYSLKVTKE